MVCMVFAEARLPVDSHKHNCMAYPQISINYNGHKTAVTMLPDSRFLVQITTQPYYLRRENIEDNTPKWVEDETNRETHLARELGKLIEAEMGQ